MGSFEARLAKLEETLMCRITIGVIVAALMTISAAKTEEQTTMWHALPQPKARPTPTYTARQPVEWSLFNPGAWGPDRPFQHTPRQPDMPFGPLTPGKPARISK